MLTSVAACNIGHQRAFTPCYPLTTNKIGGEWGGGWTCKRCEKIEKGGDYKEKEEGKKGKTGL